jgi:hypothetical protein
MTADNARVRAFELKRTEKSSCHAMAQTYNEFSWAVGFNSRLLSNYVREILGDEHSIYYIDHNDSGFRFIYQDGSNQVRHFTVYFQVGVLFSSDIAAWPLTYALDPLSKKDRDMAKRAAAIGEQMSGSQKQMKYIGEAIRSQVCSDR